MFPKKNLRRLSFIVHSFGGLIIRSALPYLEDYKHLMYSFMRFSTPHLGFIEGNFIIKTGLNLWKKYSKSKILNELSLSDSINIHDTYLYLLSKK